MRAAGIEPAPPGRLVPETNVLNRSTKHAFPRKNYSKTLSVPESSCFKLLISKESFALMSSANVVLARTCPSRSSAFRLASFSSLCNLCSLEKEIAPLDLSRLISSSKEAIFCSLAWYFSFQFSRVLFNISSWMESCSSRRLYSVAASSSTLRVSTVLSVKLHSIKFNFGFQSYPTESFLFSILL